MTTDNKILPEIQGLRAIAVGLVVAFHVWPAVLPGGYVGVDVFFVISGYLITGLLLRNIERDGSVLLLDFYARRARRLIPAATTVLIVTLTGTVLLLPQSRWDETFKQIIAASIYVQNWLLAISAVDYWDVESAASPVQHYWSLSIEEQFYLIWPLLLVAVPPLAKRISATSRSVVAGTLIIVFVCSLVASITITYREPEAAYFVTHTRVWELALGGLLAIYADRLNYGPSVRTALAVSGIILISFAGAFFSTRTAFPGIAALVPALGAVFVIGARRDLSGLLSHPVMQYIGDRSYSIYLWHWPIITFYVAHNPHIDIASGLVLVAITLVLSHLSFNYIEQPFRFSRSPQKASPVLMGLGSIATVVAVTVAAQFALLKNVEILEGDARYPGPEALLNNASTPPDIEYIPRLWVLRKDKHPYVSECHQDQTSAEPISCTLGSPKATTVIALFGDSHAAHWAPAIEKIATERGWKVVTFTKSTCPFSRIDVVNKGKPYPSCSAWRENVMAELRRLNPQFVITAQARQSVRYSELAEGTLSVWRELVANGSKVIAVEDTPWLPWLPGKCLADPSSLCTVPRSEAVSPQLFTGIGKEVTGVTVLDLTDAICDDQNCYTVVGNVIVYRDRQHLTATYSRMLAPHFAIQAGL